MNPKSLSSAKIKQFDKDKLHRLLNESILGLGDTDKLNIYNKLLNPDEELNPIEELISVLRNPNYFDITCRFLFNIELLPFQLAILQELWYRKFPMLIGSRGCSKTFLLALYSLLRAMFTQPIKIIIVGGAFRQSKLVFEYMENIWRNSEVLKNITGCAKHQGPRRDIDRCTFYIGESEVMCIPLGTGETIRGLRAGVIIADEFSSIPREVFETVVKGFTAVSSSPAKRAKQFAEIAQLKKMGMDDIAESEEGRLGFGNQLIISGTASYSFNQFYDYWMLYKNVLESKGSESKLNEIFKGEVPEGFDWHDYSVMRIPCEILPPGFLDEVSIAQSKATFHSSITLMEYNAVFSRDSDGFFKRSLIESCVTNEPIIKPDGPIRFCASITGNPQEEFIYGIDPASEQDNFAITVLQKSSTYRRLVYVWTVNRQKLRERIKNQGTTLDKSFYNYCARKIRDLMKVFPTEHIGIDSQGGGIAVMEALHDMSVIEPGEQPLWPYIKRGETDTCWWEEEEKPTDGEKGLHILHMVQFANPKFSMEANHGLRKDFETKTILFPYFDSAMISEAILDDANTGREYDTFEDCVMDIEELKDELSSIVHTQTGAGRDKWDTPEVKLPNNKKGRLRKDRYTSLVIANMVARCLSHNPYGSTYSFAGGFVGQQKEKPKSGRLYVGPDHIVSKMKSECYRGVIRNRGV